MNKNQKQFTLQPLKSEVKVCAKESKISKRKQNNDFNEEINLKKIRKSSVAKLQMFVHKAVECFQILKFMLLLDVTCSRKI